MSQANNEGLTRYDQWDTSFFSVRDTVGVPHDYTITEKHVEYSSGVYLDIEEAESKGAKCGHPHCKLPYAEHEIALGINCKSKDRDLLRDYLLSIKEQCEKDGYVGFALFDCTD